MDDFVIESVCLVRAEHVSGAERQNRSVPWRFLSWISH